MQWWRRWQLKSALRGDDVDQRIAACRELGGMSGRGAVRLLMAALKDRVIYVQEAAAISLGLHRNSLAIGPLCGSLKSEYPEVRDAAAKALGMIGQARVIDNLVEVLRSTDSKVVGESLVSLGWKPATVEQIVWLGVATGNADGILFAGPQAIRPLLLRRNSVNTQLVLNIVRDMGESAFLALVEALSDQNTISTGYSVQRCAAEVLAELGDHRAVEPICRAFRENGNNINRQSLAHCLGRFKDERATQTMIDGLSDKESYVRSAAASALGQIDDPRAFEPLVAALDDPDRDVRHSAAEALGRLGDERAVSPIGIAILKYHGNDLNYDIDGMFGALLRLGECAGPVLRDIIERATRNYQPGRRFSKDADLAGRAAQALGEIRDVDAIPVLMTALERGEERAVEALVKIGPAAIEPLRRALQHEDADMRKKAAKALGKIGDPRAADELTVNLNDEFKAGRNSAAIALAKLNDPRALPQLVQALRDEPVSNTARSQFDDYFRRFRVEAFGPLLDEVHCNEGFAELIVNLLTESLELVPNQVSVDDLHRLTNLEVVFQVKLGFDDSGTPIQTAQLEVDCSRLKQLAAEELARRERLT